MFIFKFCLLHLSNISRIIFLHIFPWIASLMMLIISGIIYSFIVRYTLINYQGLNILWLVPILFIFLFISILPILNYFSTLQNYLSTKINSYFHKVINFFKGENYVN